jgi:hypothetical protein
MVMPALLVVFAGAPAPGQNAEPQRSQPGVPAAQTAEKTPTVSALRRQIELCARGGADWLCRANRSDGRFVNGYLPALRKPLEGDYYLRQAGATLALARAAQFKFRENGKEDRWAAVARQAVLTLLLDTQLDPQDSNVRHTIFPPAIVDRGAAAGLLLLAINELPAPADDLLEQSEQLCRFITKSQRADGSFDFAAAVAAPLSGSPSESAACCAGEALCGLARSQRLHPAEWKTALLRKALPYYRNQWHTRPHLAAVPWFVAAYAEAYSQTSEDVFAKAVIELADWLCEFQYVELERGHPLWLGGFKSCWEGHPATTQPDITSAAYADALTEAYRVARQAGDLPRFRNYRESLERALQFVTTLQYAEGNTQHFAEWFRPVLLGGFHASEQDGNLRIDYNQHAVCALIKYLTYVTD